MKKVNSFHIIKFLFVVFPLIFTACENFLNGSLLKDEIDASVEYNNAKSTTVTVSARPETLAQIVPNVGDYPYKKGDPITLRFIASDGYMFKYWGANPENLIHFDDKNEINTVAKLTEYADKVNIYPVCVKRPEVISFEPRNSDGVHYKNSHIKIEFDQELSEENDFSQIAITMNGNSVQDSFFAPEWDKASKKIIIRANRKYIDLKSETETVTVKIPGSLYFMEDGQKVEIGKDKTYTYTINSATNEKAEISFELNDKDSGTLTYTQKTDNKYNIGETISINYKPAEGWVFFGWNIENGVGIVQLADDSEPKTTVEVQNQSEEPVKITPVTFKRPEAKFSPEKNDAGVPKNSSVSITFTKSLSKKNDLSKISITMDGESILEHFENPEWVEEGKGILFQANNENPIDYTASGTKSIVVKIPADFYYEENGYEITFPEEQLYTYKINSKTNVTTKISFSLNEVSSGLLNPSSQGEYNLGDKIQVKFNPDSEWQFTGWKHTGGSGVIKLTETGDYTAEIEVLRASTELVEISPVVYKRLRLASSKPESQTNGVPKDSEIELVFTNPIPETEQAEALIKQISVKIGEEDLIESGSFKTPEISDSDRTKVTIKATTKYIDLTSGTKVITVSVPADLYYEKDGNKIYAGKNISFSYRVNPDTCEKTYINFELDVPKSGELNPSGLQSYNLDEYKAVNFVMDADTYRFKGWYCSDTDAVELITKDLGVGYDDNGFNATTGVAAAYFRICKPATEADPVLIKPVAEKIPTMNIYAESKYGRFSQNISNSYKEGAVISLNFTSDPDYQFIKWQIKDKNTKAEIDNWTEAAGGYIKIDDLKNANTSFTLVQAAEVDSGINLLIEPLCAKRPKVVSWSPQYTTKGDMRDRTLVVMFNSKMDESSIYYIPKELEELGIVKITDSVCTVENGYTLLGDFEKSGTFKEGDICYGYYKNSDPDNSIVFKNIRICNLNDQTVNLLKYYAKPVFDKGNTGTLRIPTKITDESLNIDEAPPKYSEILVTLETGVNTKNGEANVKLSEEFSWAYFTNTDTDSKPPVFDNENIKIKIAEKESVDFNSVKEKTSLSEFKNPEVSITDTLSNIKTYNPKDGYIWVDLSVTDEGSGVDVVNGIFTKIHNKYYPNQSNKNETLPARIRFTLGGSANNATVSEKINLKDYGLTEGLYTLSFEAIDKNAHLSSSDEYQFIYDNVAPEAPKPVEINEIRKQAARSSLFWTNPQEKDFASVKVVSKNIDDSEESDHETSFYFNSSSYKTGIRYENYIPELTQYKHYSHKLVISDYAGNETEVDAPIDYEKPVKIKDFTESRIKTNSATLTWTKPSEADFGKVVIKRVNRTAAEKGETPDDDTIDVLSTAAQTKVYDARNFNRYEYTATVVDYSGNESEPETFTDLIKPAKLNTLAETRSSRTNARVNWTCAADVGKVKIDCFKAEKMPDGSDKETLVSSDEVNTFDKKYIDYTTLINGVRYVYKVTTTDYSGNTNEEIVQCTDNKAPAKVSSVTNRRESSGYETLTWTKPTDSDFDHVRIVQYDTRDDSLKFDNVTVEKTYNSKEFSGLKNLHKYKYLVYTVDFAGNENPSYYSFQDDEKPSPVTDVYSGGRNGKIEIYFDVPGNKKMSQVELTGSYIEAISVSSSGANDFKKTFTDLGNGTKKSFTLRVVDYSGNKSDPVSFDETSGAGVGKICHTPSGQDALCSINVYKNKNPVGVVCRDSDYGNIFIWDLYEKTGYKWSEYGFPCSDDQYWKDEKLYKDNNLWVIEVKSSDDTLNSVTEGNGKWKTSNLATGLQWLNYINSNYKDLAKDDNVWGYIKAKNQSSGSVTWFMPSILEFQYLLDGYNTMKNAYTLLDKNGYTGA
ncbi:MAG: hypothetical protein KBT11_02710, partial [Treponema sp.]|nr:hypothetical protein [Candidatus Treponema equifaecale]